MAYSVARMLSGGSAWSVPSLSDLHRMPVRPAELPLEFCIPLQQAMPCLH